MKYTICIFFLITMLSSCARHNTQKVKLYGFENQQEVKYEGSQAIFYLGADDYIEYLKDKEVKYPLCVDCRCMVDYLENCENNPITVTDSVKLTGLRKEISRNGNDTLEIPVDVYPTDNVRWAILSFAKNGNLKIFYKPEKRYLEKILVDEVESPNAATVAIQLENGLEIFDQLRWAY